MTESNSKVVILTGCSRGIGLATAHHLLQNGHKIVAVSRTHAALDQLHFQYPGQVEVLAGDLADEKLAQRAVDVALDRWGQIDSLIVNHGTLDPVKKIADTTASDWQSCFNTNVFSAVALVSASLLSLRSSKGTILLTSSGAATKAYPGWSAYGASKAVLNHLAMSLSVEEESIVTIAVRPGVVDTEMQKDIREKHGEAMGAAHERFRKLKDEGGLLRPEQPGHVIARLAAAQASQLEGLSGKFVTWDDESLGAFQED